MDNEKKWLFGQRKTTDKSVSDMGMYELALNNCFAKDHQAYFRDFVEEVSTRDIIRQIAKTLDCAGMFDEEMHNNDAFDTMMYEWLEDGIEQKTGVIALLSELMWAKAELHARLKRYEDAEERGEIGRVPRWIPVTPETMPKNMTKVITYDGTHNIVSTHIYDGEGFRAVRRADGTWAHDCCITRWMPLPDAPEVE